MARPEGIQIGYGPGYQTQRQTNIQPGIWVERQTNSPKPLILLFKLYFIYNIILIYFFRVHVFFIII